MKLKTHKGLKKRVKISSKGKFMYKKPCKNHRLIDKKKRQKELFKGGKPVHSGDLLKFERLLPYG